MRVFLAIAFMLGLSTTPALAIDSCLVDKTWQITEVRPAANPGGVVYLTAKDTGLPPYELDMVRFPLQPEQVKQTVNLFGPQGQWVGFTICGDDPEVALKDRIKDLPKD